MSRKALRRSIRIALIILLVLIVFLVVAVSFLLGTSSGRLWLSSQGIQAAQNAGLELTVDKLRSPSLGKWSAARIALTREGKPWIEIDGLELHWSPRALFQQRLQINQLEAASIDYRHLQEDSPAEPDEADGETALPDLWPIIVQRFAIGELTLQDIPLPIDTELPHYGLEGSASLFDEHPLRLDLDLFSLPNRETRLVITSQALSTTEVQFRGSLVEPAGGLIGQLMRLPEQQLLDVAFAFEVEQSNELFDIAVENIEAPLFEHKVSTRGTVLVHMGHSSVDVKGLEVVVDDNRQVISGAYDPNNLWVDIALNDLPLDIAQIWLPEVKGGSLSGRFDVAWAHSEPDTWPTIDAQSRFDLQYNEQTLSGELGAQMQEKLLTLRPTHVQLDTMRAELEGTLDWFGGQNNLHAVVHDFDTQLLKPWPIPIPEELEFQAERTQVHVGGSLQDPQIAMDTQGTGRYQQATVGITVDAQGGLERARLETFVATIDEARIDARGTLDWTGADTDVHIQFSNLDNELLALAPEEIRDAAPEELRFNGHGQAYVKGPLTAPYLTTEINVVGSYQTSGDNLPYHLSIAGDAQVAPLDELVINIQQAELRISDNPALAAQGHYHAEEIDLRLQMERLPTHVLAAFGGGEITGEAEADLHVQGTLQAPKVHGYFEYRDQVQLAHNQGREPLPLTFRTDLATEQGQLHVNMMFSQARENVGTLNVSLPLARYLQLREDEPLPLALDAKGQVDLDVLRLVLDPTIHRVGGQIHADFAIRGDTSEPQFSGEFELREGAYFNALTGTRLTEIRAILLGDGTNVQVTDTRATDAEGGWLELSGAINWGEAHRQSNDAIDLQLVAHRIALLRRRELQGELQGELAVAGSFSEMWVTGNLDIAPLNANIETTLPTPIPEIDVTEIQHDEEPQESAIALPTINLDVTLGAERQAFLRGRGLDAELAGNVRIVGTVDDPQISGRFETVRGRMDLFNRLFILEEGDVRFSNNIVSLRIIATHTDNDETVYRVELFGTADEPQLRLTAVPTLPDDEILARLIFGKSVQEINAFQAIRLAAAVRALTNGGGGFDPIESARGLLGVDTLTIDNAPSTNGDDDGISVGVGKYLNENVYLELQRITRTDVQQPWRASVQIELTPRVTLEGGTGTTGGGDARIFWRRDF